MLGFGIRHPFFGAVIEYFKTAIEREGYDILFISTKIGNSNIKTYLDHCKQRDVDGIFIVYADFNDPKIIQVLESDIPTVTIEISHQPVNSVNSDDYEGLMSAVDYLVALGHERIGHISGDLGTYSAQERRRGYEEGLNKHNIPVDDDYIVEGNLFTFEGGYKAMKKLIELENRPTAIAAAGDILALGAIKCAHDHDLHVPNDISIIGYDNIDMLGYMSPGLTTVAQNVEMMGRRAAELLIQNIADPTMNKKEIVLATKIIERDSCKSV
jgi:LacI family transcriptional regulator